LRVDRNPCHAPPPQAAPANQDRELYKFVVRDARQAPEWLNYCYKAFADEASECQARSIREFAQQVNQAWRRDILVRGMTDKNDAPDITPFLHHASEQIRFAMSEDVRGLRKLPLDDDEAGRTQQLCNLLLLESVRQRSSAPIDVRWTSVDGTVKSESVQLTLALVCDYANESSKGVLATLRLWRWPVPQGCNIPQGFARLIPAPVQCTVPNATAFAQALDNANQWLPLQLANKTPPSTAPNVPWKQYIIAYEIHQPNEDTRILHRPSASAAMALGAAWLMRDWMPGPLGQALRTLPPQALQQLVLSASLNNTQDWLRP